MPTPYAYNTLPVRVYSRAPLPYVPLPPRRAFICPPFVTKKGKPSELGYTVKPEALAHLISYRGGKRALSLGPLHNNLSRFNEEKQASLAKFARKVDTKIEILVAALYAEEYSIAAIEKHSVELLGVRLGDKALRGCIRRVFGVEARKMSRKQKEKFLARIAEIKGATI